MKIHRQKPRQRRLHLVTRIVVHPYTSKNRKGRQESLNFIKLMIPPLAICLCSVLKTCHLTKSGGDVKPRFWGLRKSGKIILLWGDPTGIVRPVEIPMFASPCE